MYMQFINLKYNNQKHYFIYVAYTNFEKANAIYKSQADKKRRPKEFSIRGVSNGRTPTGSYSKLQTGRLGHQDS